MPPKADAPVARRSGSRGPIPAVRPLFKRPAKSVGYFWSCQREAPNIPYFQPWARHLVEIALLKEVRKMASVLFSPIALRGVTLPNRVVVSPMCQYNSNNGSANDWHLMHLGSFSLGCAGLVMCEMTNVNPIGRISPKCAGMYSDDNEMALKRVHDFCRTYGVAKLGVQLAHAGRKGPTTPPAAGGKPILTKEEGGWTPEAPSAIP